MHDGPELDERRREDDAGAPEANTPALTVPPISVDAAPIGSAIPAWLSASFASVAAAACGGGTDRAAVEPRVVAVRSNRQLDVPCN